MMSVKQIKEVRMMRQEGLPIREVMSTFVV